MIGLVLGSIKTQEIPSDVEWNTQTYTRLSEYVRIAMNSLDAIEHGRSMEWITIWRVPIVDKDPDLSSATPCSITTDFLSRQIEDVWYYVQIRTEVAQDTSFSHLRCRTGQPKPQEKKNKTEEHLRLLRSLDTQTALSEISNERAAASREDAAKWHSECLAKDRIINEREIRIRQLEAELESAIANQAPVVDDLVAEKLGTRALEFLETWATTPSDKGYAARVLQAVLSFMASIQHDEVVLYHIMKKHKPAFEGIINAFNEVAKAAKLPGSLGLPPMPKLPRESVISRSSKKIKQSEARRGSN